MGDSLDAKVTGFVTHLRSRSSAHFDAMAPASCRIPSCGFRLHWRLEEDLLLNVSVKIRANQGGSPWNPAIGGVPGTDRATTGFQQLGRAYIPGVDGLNSPEVLAAGDHVDGEGTAEADTSLSGASCQRGIFFSFGFLGRVQKSGKTF